MERTRFRKFHRDTDARQGLYRLCALHIHLVRRDDVMHAMARQRRMTLKSARGRLIELTGISPEDLLSAPLSASVSKKFEKC